MGFDSRVQAAFDWLVDGAPGAATPMDVIERLLPELVAGGVPVERFSAFVRSLHPHVVARGFFWQPGQKVVVRELSWAQGASEAYAASPVRKLMDEGAELRLRPSPGTSTGYAEVDQLFEQGHTDYLALPMKFMGGSVNVVAYATRAPGGFGDAHLAALRHVTRALSRVAETLALMRTAVNLLNTYVGRDAGERILKGRIQRGDTEAISCVIWFSDLRGFTSLSDERTPAQIIAVLNEMFDCQVPAIEANGGQVLKFIGDGMLAIFPVGSGRDARAAGDAAVAASAGASAALDALNARRVERGEPALKFGVALHVGEVAYGNIGGASRLDFTAIGPAVNLASRLEGLTGKLDKRVLVSAELAQVLSAPTRAAGSFELKGVAKRQDVFELA